ncbi:uncharacterized protein LOC115763296 [Drosophila novamexicana]|uniref:uncharacterized protein LOC115763296 n=1 Tax=Drosophila novamexicana TaxID=47314 RepID=UPI0011E58EB8|nr:uncharacterized protein LOC115763296 [Drosophila novamexicana]
MDMNEICRIRFLVTFWLLAIWPPVHAARRSRYVLKWSSFDCVNLWPIISNYSCRIQDDGNLSSDIQLTEPITEVWVKYQLVVPRPIQKTEMVLFDSAFDACKLLRDGVMRNKLAYFVYQNMIRNSNLAKVCPISEGPLYFHNISGLDQFPAFMPEMDFTLSILFYKPNTTHGLNTTLKGSLFEPNRQRQKFWN